MNQVSIQDMAALRAGPISWGALRLAWLGLCLLCVLDARALAAPPLTRQEACGRKIYFRGTDCAGKEIKGFIGDLEVSAKLQPCASCHGPDGKGRPESGQDPGDITWSYLSVPYGHKHANGRKHAAFTEALFERAVTTGRDPAGGKLSQLMPRFRLSPTSAAQLVAYLKRVATDIDPGIGPKSITLGSMAPLQGVNTETGNAARAVLAAYFEDLNKLGGIYGRRIVLRFAASDVGNTLTIRNARHLVASPIFALVAPFVPGAEKELADLAHASNVPLVGLLALSVPDEPANREVFYLLPGFEQLEQELMRFAATQGKLAPAKTAVIFADDSLRDDVSAAMHATWQELGVGAPAEQMLGSEDRERMAGELKGRGIENVFLVGGGEQVSQWVQAADRLAWAPKVFVLGPLLDQSILNAPERFQGKIFAAYPQLQPELGGVDEFDDFLARHKLPGDHRLIRISAYCAAKVLEEALTHAGRNLTREKLILSLEQLRDFKTGMLPGITFGPNRRIGSTKAEIVCVDLESHSFQPECGGPHKSNE
jgi:ABC-type branched-subunit amino acid transport system substrate-binding protein